MSMNEYERKRFKDAVLSLVVAYSERTGDFAAAEAPAGEEWNGLTGVPIASS